SAGVTPSSPAFALCLFAGQEEADLLPGNIALGLESDRERLVAGQAPWNAYVEVWNPTNYSYISLDDFDDPSAEPGFAAASSQLLEWAREISLVDPALWLLEEVAALLTRDPTVEPVTDDFACWVFDE